MMNEIIVGDTLLRKEAGTENANRFISPKLWELCNGNFEKIKAILSKATKHSPRMYSNVRKPPESYEYNYMEVDIKNLVPTLAMGEEGKAEKVEDEKFDALEGSGGKYRDRQSDRKLPYNCS